MIDRCIDARERIQVGGARVTSARTRVLAVLLGAERALSHHEVERRVWASAPLDRVTVYRVLEWLTKNHLAHRVSGNDRVWRFSACGGRFQHRHAHFECQQCGTVMCLEDNIPRAPRLPKGYRPQRVETTVRGRCAHCP
ncbi:MAG: Fur family transcriptional regulator [Burkholderiales bacterium]